MKKYYVLDTNVLLHSPTALFAFSEHFVIIPEVVLEELDRFKSEATERGANSREVSRIIDSLRTQGNLLEGVAINHSEGILKIENNHGSAHIPPHWSLARPDNRILQIGKGLAESGVYTVIVSRDTNMRVKAAILGVQAEDFRNEKVVNVNEQYTGRAEVYTTTEVLNRFYKEDAGCIDAGELYTYDEISQTMHRADLTVNQFLHIRSTDSERQSALGRFDGTKAVHLRFREHKPFGVIPRNIGQIFMQECLMMNPEEAPLVIIKGMAGTAKTFYALAVGLHKCMDSRPREYHHLLICRPHVPMDEEIGFLPGSESEKIGPYMRGIRDNLFTLMSGQTLTDQKEAEQVEDTVQLLFDKRIIQTEALAYQRGRSLYKYWMILDEMQNSTPRQAKGVITRPGLGTKIVLLGDPAQIDHPHLDCQTNGLVYASEKMRGSRLCFQVTLQPDECERSPLAAEAAMRL